MKINELLNKRKKELQFPQFLFNSLKHNERLLLAEEACGVHVRKVCGVEDRARQHDGVGLLQVPLVHRGDVDLLGVVKPERPEPLPIAIKIFRTIGFFTFIGVLFLHEFLKND